MPYRKRRRDEDLLADEVVATELHEAIKGDCPTPYASTIEAYREILPALARQVKDPNHFVERKLPNPAKAVPYNHGAQFVAAS